MTPEQLELVTGIVANIIKTVGVIGTISGVASFGIVEMIKKIGIPSKFYGIAAWVAGFTISILVCKLVMGTYFSPLSILIGIMVAFGTPGVYSGVKALTRSTKIEG